MQRPPSVPHQGALREMPSRPSSMRPGIRCASSWQGKASGRIRAASPDRATSGVMRAIEILKGTGFHEG